MKPPDPPAPHRRFRVALSFPGERRDFVEAVAGHLADALGRASVLYDVWYEAEFARPDLDTYLQSLYRDQSDLIAVFLCADYERKDWCRLEWRAVRDLIKCRRGDSVMPLCFETMDRTGDSPGAVPGLFSTDGYVWIGDRPPEAIAGLILERLGLPVTGPGPRLPATRRQPRWPLVVLPLLIVLGLVLGLVGASHLVGRTQPLAGTILDATGRPIPGVRVAVPELGLDTRTDALGHFSLQVPGREPRQVQLIATAPGLSPHRQYVLPGTDGLSFTLRPD